jgi:hypothetical protein
MASAQRIDWVVQAACRVQGSVAPATLYGKSPCFADLLT